MTYIVKNGNTLGYLLPGNSMGVLASKIDGHDPKCGPVSADPAIDCLRSATAEDFKYFKVSPRFHLD